MKLIQSLIVFGLCLSTAFAGQPRQLITHNNTPYQSNAFVGPNFSIPSPHPTKANDTNRVFWGVVQVICGKRSGSCSALIKMKTNTSAPVEVGVLNLNLDNGDITPKVLKGNGFTLTVNGVGEATITED